jgi:NADPH2:quinone reductase
LFNCLNTREELLRRADAVFSGLEQGWLKLKVDYVFPLIEAAKAQNMLETRQTTGKVVLSV